MSLTERSLTIQGPPKPRRVSLMKKLILSGSIVIVAIVMVQTRSQAVTSPGWRELAVQVPDINLQPGIPAYLPVELKTVELDNTLPNDSGLYAMSTVPGLSIISAYGFGTPTTIPPNNWAPIGEAEGFGAGSTPWFGHFNGITDISIQKFVVTFDGTALNATQGSILIAVNQGGDTGDLSPRIIGSINVFVRQSSKPAWFMVTATSTTISGSQLILSHPFLNGDSNANVFVTHVYDAPGHAPMYWNHPVSVSYDANLKRWTILNDDGVDMPVGIVFNVRIDPSAIVVKTLRCQKNVPVFAIPIDHPSASFNPYATIIVTPRGPDFSPIAVKYAAPTWYIVHADGSKMPVCNSYNVQVMGFSEYFDINSILSGWLDPFVSNAAGVSIEGSGGSGAPRNLPFWWQLGNPDEPIIVTLNLTPPPAFFVSAVSDSQFVGVSYSDGSAPITKVVTPQWQIINEDGTPPPNEASFNVWGQPQLTP
jgi:hypothetical protein